jgi:SulP family sulfate permease
MQVDWGIIASQAGNLLVISLVSIVALLLNVSALELIAQKDMDTPRELKTMGAANMVTGFLGGSVSYHYLGLSGLTMRMNANSRLVGVLVAVFLGIVLLFGATVLALVPKVVIGGLLLFLGLSFLMEWVYDAWFRMPKMEYLLVLTILAVVGGVGFLEGVGVGVIGAIILFAVNYGQIDVVNIVLTGASYRSNTERPPEHYLRLEKYGDQLHILRLHGFVFFGTANGLLNRVRARINDKAQPPLKYLLVDLQRVTSLDSSAAMGFIRIHQLTKAENIHLIFTSVSTANRRILELNDLHEDETDFLQYFPTLDLGAEWCETRILAEYKSATIIRTATLRGQFNQIFGREMAERFMAYLKREQMEKNDVVFWQGDPSDSMFFIESGQLTASFETSNDKSIRLRTMGAGTVVGEISVYLGQPRTATIVASKPSVIHRLTLEALKEMELKDSDLAVRMHIWLARILSQRITDYNKTLEILLN